MLKTQLERFISEGKAEELKKLLIIIFLAENQKNENIKLESRKSTNDYIRNKKNIKKMIF